MITPTPHTPTTFRVPAGLVIEHEPHEFIAEASDVGLMVGEWPASVDLPVGNGMPFIRTSKKVRDGDLLWVTYVQANGCVKLRIFND